MLSFIFGLIIFPLIKIQYEVNPDEGINLIKGFLLNQGYQFAIDIWSDQPPFLAFLFSLIHRIAEGNLFYYRAAIAIFSLVLVLVFNSLLRIRNKSISSYLSFILMISPCFFNYSFKLMIGVPSLSLSLLGCWFFLRKKTILAYSMGAILLALSFQTKFLAILIFPALLFYLFQKILSKEINVKSLILPIILLITLNLFFVWIWNLTSLEQLVETHLVASRAFEDLDDYKFQLISNHFPNYFIFFILFSIIWIIYLKQLKENIFILVWFFVSLIFVFTHKPLWEHHLINLYLPSLLIIAVPLNYFLERKKKYVRWLIFFPITIFIYMKKDKIYYDESLNNAFVENIKMVKQFNPKNEIILSDRPIYAFVNNFTQMPNYACFSEKRIRSSNLTTKNLINDIQKFKPSLIVVSRFRSLFEQADLNFFLQENYKLEYSQYIDLYVRK